MMRLAWIVLFALMLLLGGCIGKRPKNPAATQPVTNVDPATGTVAYWLSQPGYATVGWKDFTQLWETAENVARLNMFQIDRRDYRGGLLTTRPMVSKQLFEPWRKDAGTASDVVEASLGTIRRTIYFQFEEVGGGEYRVWPKVVVERQSKVDPKYRDDYDLPATYWYALRRDKVMEEKLADSIRNQLMRKG